ncbi:MAG: glycosyltransferase family 2 protein [Acidimicrobiales bacterium]|nr:glycosyltransferase family 2 protein [Acidimicrobiales bacterium]
MSISGVSAVVPTRDRPELLRATLDAILAQSWDNPIETVVVFDQSEPDLSLESDDRRRPVRVVRNDHTPGLPGARNAGVAHATHNVIAFCDDDDLWTTEKTARQVAVLSAQPGTDVVTTGVSVVTPRSTTERLPGRDRLTLDMLVADRVFAAHPSTVMVRRRSFLETIGPVDEHIPGGYAEDYEWILRAAALHPIAVVDEALVQVRWNLGSHFAGRWDTIDAALEYLLDTHPEFDRHAAGHARIVGQRAFATAAAGRRRDAWRLVRDTVRLDPRQARGYLAAAVALRLVTADRVVGFLNRRGRGI